MLGHRIAVPSPGALRYDRLQLLLVMLLDDGVVPTVDESKPGAPLAPTRAKHRPRRR